jgi:hypothetical protein
MFAQVARFKRSYLRKVTAMLLQLNNGGVHEDGTPGRSRDKVCLQQVCR